MGTSASAASQASCTARRESQTTPATDAGGLSITFIERRHHRDAKASGRGSRSFFAHTASASSAQHRAACLTDRKDRRLRILRRTGPNTGVLERGLHVLELSRSQLGRIRR